MTYIQTIIKKYMQDNGIKPYEIFKIGNHSKGWFDENMEFHKTEDNQETVQAPELLMRILGQQETITFLAPFMPEKMDPYYFHKERNPHYPELTDICMCHWINSIDDFSRFLTGNCFRSRKEAMENKTMHETLQKNCQNIYNENKKKAYAKKPVLQ